MNNNSDGNDHPRRPYSLPTNATADADSVMSFGTKTALTDLYAGGGVGKHRKRTNPRRSAHIRILVLGPPVGFPRCFDDYYHYNIEAMISGPEVAMALYEWVSNKDERKRLQVERAANELKEKILLEPSNQIAATLKPKNNASNEGGVTAVDTAKGTEENPKDLPAQISGQGENQSQASSSGRSSTKSSSSTAMPIQRQIPSATLTNVTGSDLAREVREILKNQKLAAETQKQQQLELEQQQKLDQQRKMNGHSAKKANGNMSTVTGESSIEDLTVSTAKMSTSSTVTSGNENQSSVTSSQSHVGTIQVFAGLEETARHSRIRQKAMASEIFHDEGEDEFESVAVSKGNHVSAGTQKSQKRQNHDREVMEDGGANTNHESLPMAIQSKKRLRWHALVDSGMGRLGFKTDLVLKDGHEEKRDTVEILKELVDLEVTLDCPIEFHGMCTHMADASNSTSTFTDSQMNKFKSLLKRVRKAGISVPTLSTDNSAALLTTNLTHFTANTQELLTQADADSRGFVRTGGAIYGQRPSFPQLRAVSTLMASVRHVATLKKGESVGYDRAYVASINVRIATLTIGFADGYPRDLGNGIGRVSIRGHLFPVAGNVCMDMLMVELGPAEDENGVGAQVVVGDTAILWGPDDGEEGEGHVRLQDVAAILKTTQSALTCGLNKERVLRRYA